MGRKRLLKLLIFLMIFMFLADLVAQKLYWYSSIWWFDMVMHFLGGFWVGLFFIWFFSIASLPFFRLSLEKIDWVLIRKTILFVLLFGVLWELFEIYTHNYIAEDPFNALDSLSDIFFDLSGGFLALVYFNKRIMFEDKNGLQ